MRAPAAEGKVRDLGVAREVEVAVRVRVDGTERLIGRGPEIPGGIRAAAAPIGRSRRREEQEEASDAHVHSSAFGAVAGAGLKFGRLV